VAVVEGGAQVRERPRQVAVPLQQEPHQQRAARPVKAVAVQLQHHPHRLR
jgi:hypothetical protein